MEYWEIKLEAERLRLSSPDAVYAWLSALPSKKFLDNCSESIVQVLLARDHPLIDLGLARYVSNCHLVRHLWEKSDILRTALLSNRAYGPIFPTSHTFRFPDRAGQFIETMDDNDLDVLYSNPMIMPAVLEQTFTNELGLTPKMHSRASRYAASNKILQDKLIDETFDEFVDNYQVSEARQALWALVLKAPPTEDWALVLGDAAQVIFEPGLPKEFQPDPSTSQEKLETGRAWRDRREAYRLLVIDAAEKRWLGPEDKRSEPYNIWRNARAAFAEAVCRAHSDKTPIVPNHPDLGFRIGFYRGAAVSPSWNIEAMSDRDGNKFLDAIMFNDSLYERNNWSVYRRVRCVADRDHLKWMKARSEALSKKDPARYDNTPTAEEVLEEGGRIEAQAAAAASRPQDPEPERTPSPKPPKRGWRPFG